MIAIQVFIIIVPFVQAQIARLHQFKFNSYWRQVPFKLILVHSFLSKLRYCSNLRPKRHWGEKQICSFCQNAWCLIWNSNLLKLFHFWSQCGWRVSSTVSFIILITLFWHICRKIIIGKICVQFCFMIWMESFLV